MQLTTLNTGMAFIKLAQAPRTQACALDRPDATCRYVHIAIAQE